MADVNGGWSFRLISLLNESGEISVWPHVVSQSNRDALNLWMRDNEVLGKDFQDVGVIQDRRVAVIKIHIRIMYHDNVGALQEGGDMSGEKFEHIAVYK